MEKWCIKITRENEKEIGEYYDLSTGRVERKLYSNGWIGSYFNSHNELGKSVMEDIGNNFTSFTGGNKPTKGHRVIEIEEFRTLIKKEPSYELY